MYESTDQIIVNKSYLSFDLCSYSPATALSSYFLPVLPCLRAFSLLLHEHKIIHESQVNNSYL